MQPSLSLIATSFSAAIALSFVGSKPVQAASVPESSLQSKTGAQATVLGLANSDESLSSADPARTDSVPTTAATLHADTAIAQSDETTDGEATESIEVDADLDLHNEDEPAIAEPDTDADEAPSISDLLVQDVLDDEEPVPDPIDLDPIDDDPLDPDLDDPSDPDQIGDDPSDLDLTDDDSLDVEEDLEDLPEVEPEAETEIEVDPERLNDLGNEESPPVLDLTDSVDPEVFGLEDDELPVVVPEYLNSPANPLELPTEPDEIELSGTQPVTLEQVIEIARRNSTELQEALLQLEQTQAALREAQAAYLPTLDADLTLTHQGVNTFQTSQQADPEDPLGGVITVTDSIYIEQTTLNGNLNLSYDIFTSGQRSALVRAAEERVRLQELQVEVIAEQLRLDVTQDYYDLQETDELVRIAGQSLEESLQSLRDAQALERAGVGTRFDVLQAEVEAANSRQDLIQALSDQEVARRQLSQRLNSAESIDLSAADPIDIAGYWDIPLEESIALAYQNRAELEQQLAQREISEQQRRAQLSALGPQLSAFAQYNFADLLDESESSADSETYAIGLQARIQLYDGGAARAAARQEEVNIALAENAFEDAKRTIRFQVEQSYSAMQSNLENIQTALLAVETATEALRLARLRFQAGVGTQTDVLQAQTDLTRAEVNRLQAVLGYNRALAQLQRSVSNLPDSNLVDRP